MEQNYYLWRKKYGGLSTTSQAKRLKELEKENCRLKRLVADLSMDNAVVESILTITSVNTRSVLIAENLDYEVCYSIVTLNRL